MIAILVFYLFAINGGLVCQMRTVLQVWIEGAMCNGVSLQWPPHNFAIHHK